MKEMVQIQDNLNKEVKRGLVHLLQGTHKIMLLTVPVAVQGGDFSVYKTMVPMHHHTLICTVS